MPPLPPDIAARIAPWPDSARDRFTHLRTLCHAVATTAEVGPLDESLKWGQPAWRPRRPRTGSTLRAWWSADHPDRLDLFVDCKTTLAADVADRFPRVFGTDGRRVLSLALDTPAPDDALWHLAFATFTYHLNRQASAD